jgi:hypothetical protein
MTVHKLKQIQKKKKTYKNRGDSKFETLILFDLLTISVLVNQHHQI